MKSNIFMREIMTFIAFILFTTLLKGQFQPNNVAYIGNDLNEAVNNALRDWEIQYGKAQNYLGSVNVDLSITDNEELFLQAHNQIRLAINGKTLGSTTFSTPQIVGKEVIIKNFLTLWKEPRRLEHINASCDYSVHQMDTAIVFSCAHPIIGPIYQWKKFGILNAPSIYDGESNVETGGTGDQEEDFRFATELAIYGFWFQDASANWGHLQHMIRSTSQKMALHIFYKNASSLIALYYESTKGTPTLPLSLLSFSATADKDNSVLLSWQTAEEVGRDNMTLYRSTDAKDWEEIYRITSSGNYSGNMYHYKDVDIHCDRYYYKLVVNDKEWIREVSLNENEAQIHIYPNPTDGLVVVKNPSDSPIFVFDAIGKLIQSFENQNDITKIQLDRGVYIFQIGNQKEKVVVR